MHRVIAILIACLKICKQKYPKRMKSYKITNKNTISCTWSFEPYSLDSEPVVCFEYESKMVCLWWAYYG